MKDKKELCGRIAEGEFLEEEISSYLTDKELLKELEVRIKVGRIKIDWIEDGEEYNEESSIKGLYTKDFNLSLIWTDESETVLFYKLFPSRKERKEAKTGSWRNILMKEWKQEDKEFFEKEMKLVKGKKNGNN